MSTDPWMSFYLRADRTELYVGMLPVYLNQFLKASDRQVRISHPYAAKAVEKHKIEPSLLAQMPLTLRYGEVFFDRERHLTFVYFSSDLERWFQLTVKCCTEKRHLFVATFHGLGRDDVKRIRKRFERVWPLQR